MKLFKLIFENLLHTLHAFRLIFYTQSKKLTQWVVHTSDPFVRPLQRFINWVVHILEPAARLFHEIRGLLFLLSTLFMSAVFLLTKTGDYKNFYPYFPFNQDVVLTRDTYVYFLFERLIMVVMSLFIYFESSKFRTALKVFVFIQIFDAVDYVLTYNKTWEVYGFLVSWDVLKVALFSLAIANEVLLMAEQKLQNE